MPKLIINHRTTYRYREPVKLSAHRLILRPRESRELTLLSHRVSISPDTELSWATDVFGNVIATATFGKATEAPSGHRQVGFDGCSLCACGGPSNERRSQSSMISQLAVECCERRSSDMERFNERQEG